jgi:hypothetical protein
MRDGLVSCYRSGNGEAEKDVSFEKNDIYHVTLCMLLQVTGICPGRLDISLKRSFTSNGQ